MSSGHRNSVTRANACDRVVAQMSDWEPDSDLSRFNAAPAGSWVAIPPEFATVVSAGVVPTPAIAYLARTEGFDAGIVISASHNPYEDNGIKVFGGAGTKLTEQLEASVEKLVADQSWSVPEGKGTIERREDLFDH